MWKRILAKRGARQLSASERQWVEAMGLTQVYISALERELRQVYSRLHAANAIIKRLREGRKL